MSQNQSPIPHIPFHFLPPNPNPNPNSQPQIPQAQSLSATISALDGLIHQSEHSIQSLFSQLHLQTPNRPSSNGFVTCPFDSRHSVPSNSLFSHYLRCSSTQFPLQSDLLPNPNYPETLTLSDSYRAENGTIRTLHGSDSELCFSLDDFYADFGSNFFYRNCHGVVSLSSLEGFDRTFTLPVFLSVECANVVGSSGKESSNGFESNLKRIFPSELWAIRIEVETWNECPSVYSYCVLCALLGLNVVRECDLAKWMITNSPRYGIVIDEAMTNHILLLCNLCLKAIRKEALPFDKTVVKMNFSCPVLVQALTWLASQLSVLFGEVGARLFALNILKQCILDAASSILIFPLEHREAVKCSYLDGVPQSLDNKGFESQPAVDVGNNEGPNDSDEKCVTSGVIFVSQVAAAIAALHERSFLEENIKELRFHCPLNKYQRMAEHDYVLHRADEERRRRPQHRPIIEHDGLPRLKLSNEELSKPKTREELLAEERDYKRRRMSYRGKKVKRSKLEVTRDIIEDFMDEIKQAGGIGCFEKVNEREDALPFETPIASNMITDVHMPKESNHNPSVPRDNSSYHSRKESHSNSPSNYGTRSASFKARSDEDYEKSKRRRYDDREFAEDERSFRRSRDKEYREYYSRSPSDNQSSERSHQRREQNEMGGRRTKHHDSKNSSSTTSRYRDNNRSTPQEFKSKSKDKWYDGRYESRISKPHSRSTFEDRYDPSVSRGIYEDDVL